MNSIAAPWLNYFNPKRIQILKAILLLTPFAIFLSTGCLLFSPSYSIIFHTRDYPNMYSGVYTLSFTLFILSYSRILVIPVLLNPEPEGGFNPARIINIKNRIDSIPIAKLLLDQSNRIEIRTLFRPRSTIVFDIRITHISVSLFIS